MESNKNKFEPHGYLAIGIARTIEIQISRHGDQARYRALFGTKEIHGRWQEIRYTIKNGDPYIMMSGKRLYFRDFMRYGYV